MYWLAYVLHIKLSVLRIISSAILWKKFNNFSKPILGLVQGVRENALTAGTWEVTAVDSLKPQKPLGGQPKGGESSREN